MFTGVCIRCSGINQLDEVNLYDCVPCALPLGPVLNPTACATEATTVRAVPAFTPTSVQVDWRLQNVINPVKDQGQCGSCYAFSTAGAASASWAIKTGQLFDISE
jgi:C1A family cysteine protease